VVNGPENILSTQHNRPEILPTICYLLIPMKSKTNIKLPLTVSEKASLRTHKIKIADILDFPSDELEVLLQTSSERAREIYALAEFQTVPSVGIKFAEDLVFLGYFSFKELQDKDGEKLTDYYEVKKGYWTDPCVEDQFRLVVHFANTNDQKKMWWDFTEERKKFRIENGYPSSRPQKAWFEILGYRQKDKKGSNFEG
jgi:hypothetical protein